MGEMAFDTKLIERLRHLSDKGHYDPYTRFNWSSEIDRGVLWCDEDLLTTYGTPLHERLSYENRVLLSQWECINFFSLNVHGIKDALQFVVNCMYETRYKRLSDYMHIFMAEENAHMWFFAKFCIDYAGKIYPNIPVPQGKVQSVIERELYMFASTLIFEEYVDFYNSKVGINQSVPVIVREINHQHHVDESRHISFGRNVVRTLFDNLIENDRDGTSKERVADVIGKIFKYFIGIMYNPSVYDDAGIVPICNQQNAASLRNHLRYNADRKLYHEKWFRRTATFFVNSGMLPDTSCVA